jgi:hypothetical protein
MQRRVAIAVVHRGIMAEEYDGGGRLLQCPLARVPGWGGAT